jgi:poly(3-hydroxyalkanoate) synthetase
VLTNELNHLNIIDWGYPDETDKNRNLDVYINIYLDHCVDAIRDKHKLKKSTSWVYARAVPFPRVIPPYAGIKSVT